MNQKNNDNRSEESQDSANGPNVPSEQGAADSANGPDDAGMEFTQDQAALVQEVDQLKDKLLRAAADYQNMVRRSQLNVTEAREQQVMEIAKALVTTMDHFDRALQVDTEKVTAQTLLQGVQIVYNELLKTLEQFGIKRLDIKPGEEFNPNRHQALLHQKVDGIAPGHVAAQLQPGYLLNERTLRPAMVSLAE